MIQPPTQEDELDINSSTLVNSMEIAAPEDSVELPPPIDVQQVLELNQVPPLQTSNQLSSSLSVISFVPRIEIISDSCA